MYFRRLSPINLQPPPSDQKIYQASLYFPGLDLSLLHQWWVYCDEGGSVDAEDISYAVQYAVIITFLKSVTTIRTYNEAIEFVQLGISAEADGINRLKGTDDVTEAESAAMATGALMAALENSDAQSLYQESYSMHSSYSSSSSSYYGGWNY